MTKGTNVKRAGCAAAICVFCAACKGAAPSAPKTVTTAPETHSEVSGPLTSLRAADGKHESFTFEDKPAVAMLQFGEAHVCVSASCSKPDGSLNCDAIRSLRKGKQVKLDGTFGGANPGAVACKKLGLVQTTGRSPRGDEDGFCIYPDGSMVSTGALDQYVVGE
jgi:putative hemolysin